MIIQVKVKTNSSQSRVFVKDGIHIVSLHSSPKKGKANKELVDILSKHFDISKSNIRIIKGEKSRRKILSVE